MKPLPRSSRVRPPGARERAGAALMVTLLVLFVLVAVVFQISITTGTDARVTRNVVNTTSMELAIESALLKFMDELAQDAEQAGAGAAGGAGAAPLVSGGGGGLPGLGGGGAGGADTDSQMDDWARPRPTTINGIEVVFWAQDEDSKYNVLTMLTEDPEEADKAEERVARILDFCREGTLWDIDTNLAEEMAAAMRETMQRRRDAVLPRPRLLTDDEEEEDRGLPLTLAEFAALPQFVVDPENRMGRYFEDFLDADGAVVHSLGSFLTVSTSTETFETYKAQRDAAAAEAAGEGESADLNQAGTQAPEGALPTGTEGTADRSVDQAQGMTQVGGEVGGPGGVPGAGPVNGVRGVAVNLNTSPRAVLEGLFDDRDVEREFWFRVLEYRNEELEDEDDDDEEPLLDEFGEEIVELQTFQSIADLAQIDGWEHLEPLVKAEVENLVTVKSHTFSVFLVARRRTGGELGEFGTDREAIREEREQADALTVAVRSLVWRRQTDQGWEIVPIERWERLSYVPYPVQDFPDEDR